MKKINARKNKQKLKRKNDLPKLASDQDFLDVFLEDNKEASPEKKSKKREPCSGNLNKHGLPFLDDYESVMTQSSDFKDIESSDPTDQNKTEDDPPEAFPDLLEASLKQNRPLGRPPKPMPLKRRLKRYPPPEADLDLHGFTAIGATLKARSFISTAHIQGFFTLRIIVGKGLHSDDGPVLPHVVEDLLKEMKKENVVLAYEWEGKKRSKSGAVIVYLKRFEDYY